MPRAKNWTQYPPQYLELIEHIGEGVKSSTIELESTEQALKLRGQYYAFTGALRRARKEFEALQLRRAGELAEHGKAWTPIHPELKRAAELSVAADAVQCNLRGNFLTFMHKSLTWQSSCLEKAIEGAVEKAGAKANILNDAAEAAAKRMLEKLGGGMPAPEGGEKGNSLEPPAQPPKQNPYY